MRGCPSRHAQACISKLTCGLLLHNPRFDETFCLSLVWALINVSFSETAQENETEEVAHVLPEDRSVTFATETPALDQEIAAFKMDLLGVDPDDSATGPPFHELISKIVIHLYQRSLK